MTSPSPLSVSPSRWTLGRQSGRDGTPNFLIRSPKVQGKRRQLFLGSVTESKAAEALATWTAMDDTQAAAFLLLWETDRDQAKRVLLDSDQALAKALDDHGPDWSRATLREYFRGLYQDHRANTRPRSWRTEERAWTVRILPDLGDHRLDTLRDPRIVARWLEGLTSEHGPRKGQPLSGASKRIYRSHVQGLLTFAWSQGHVRGRNDDTEPPRLGVVRIEGSTETVRDMRDPLTLADLAALSKATEAGTVISGGGKGATITLDGSLRAMIVLGAGMGLRPSELIRVRWEDWDRDASTLRIRGSKTKASDAVVPLTSIGLDALATWWDQAGQPTEGPVFVSRRTGKPYATPSGYKKALVNAAKRAKLAEPKRVNPYLLRHSFVTIAKLAGLDIDVVQAIGRWTDRKMIEDHYYRPTPAQLVPGAMRLRWRVNPAA